MILRVLIYCEDGCWIAHCLETDFVADGSSPINAIKHLLSLIDFDIHTLLTDKRSTLIKRVTTPPEILLKFTTGSNCYFNLNLPKCIKHLIIRKERLT